MISTVLRNLISNAIKFTPHDRRVTISTESTHEENRQMVQIKVVDTGVGMKPEEIKKVFSIDNRYSRSGTNNEAGTGSEK